MSFDSAATRAMSFAMGIIRLGKELETFKLHCKKFCGTPFNTTTKNVEVTGF